MITIETFDQYTLTLYKDGEPWEVLTFQEKGGPLNFIHEFLNDRIVSNA